MIKFLQILIVFLVFSPASLAQESVSPPPVEKPADPDGPSPDVTAKPVEDDPEVTTVKDPLAGEYVKGTVQNLSKLYWRLQVFDDGDDRAIDNFMLINECAIYQNHINDEFEWANVRDAAKSMLKQEKKKFPLKFDFILPVELDTYDTERRGFPITRRLAFQDVRRLEISGNSLHREICGVKGEIKDYPRNVMLILKQPFTYDFAEVEETLAQAYILKRQQEIMNLDLEDRQKQYERPGYVRLRITFNQYQGTVKGNQGHMLAILYGSLDGIDLFGDPYEKMLLGSLET